MSVLGGLSEPKKATPEIQAMTDSVEAAARQMAGQDFDMFKATLYRDQVVAGMNYFIKVHVGGPKYVHLRVFQALPQADQPPRLDAMQLNKTATDPITYFE
ncbi:leukocyte cysteine proteinase inhibitor 1-like [Dendronephthya gigantea]|uniref:leukocyte cysteine proteinase inhibitor 1-like n=1 Tax=Dendronephthya gigantea TaxID=151771 RepID=UPI001069B0E2|nr:leukocyte cysteine proteinase inhibitor 1-like [Dendronephthya gigantea]